MLKRMLKRSQCGDLIPHLGKESQIPFTDMLTGVLFQIGQDCFRLMQEAVGILQRRPERCRGLQSFGKELLKVL